MAAKGSSMAKRLLLCACMALCISYANGQSTTWGVDFADAIIARWPNSINDMTNKGWEYSNGIVLQGIERVHAYTNKDAYVNYIKKYVDQFVDANGKVPVDASTKSLDKIHPVILCLFLYKETNQQKYKIAADSMLALLKQYPTNPSGGFWHKANNANQMLLDGIYMAEPFLAKYGYQIGERSYCDSMAAFQILLLSSHAYVASKKLLLHGWDETKKAAWANPATGLSSEIWSRATGWFSMALVEVLKYFPKDHPQYAELLALLNNIAEGIKNTQDAATGLWYQVVDKGNLSDNWLESSGSGMLVYALKTAVDCGFIDKSYLSVAQKGWTGLKTKITRDNKNLPVINGFVGSMNVLNTYTDYVKQTVVNCPPSTHPHGYCGALMAASAMELAKTKYRLSISTVGQGSVTNPTGEMFQDSGSVVRLSAVPASGYHLSQWSGDADGTDLTAAIAMNSEKNITATFVQGSSIKTRPIVRFVDGVSNNHAGKTGMVTVTLSEPQNVAVRFFDCEGRAMTEIAYGMLGTGAHRMTLKTKNFANGRYFTLVITGKQEYMAPLLLME
jgi:unsaturated rhamnogalacturonyl hydrolase